MFALTPFGRINRYAAFDPFREIEELEKAFFTPQPPAIRTDIRETDTAYILEAELPGFKKEEISVTVDDGMLTIKASHSSEDKTEEGKNDYIRRERSYRTYSRSFGLDGIDKDSISAAYRDGILELNLPKEEPKKPTARTLEIK